MGLLREALGELKTRDDLERALALVSSCLILPSKSVSQDLLLMMGSPTVGELLLTPKQAELYAKARLMLYQQRR